MPTIIPDINNPGTRTSTIAPPETAQGYASDKNVAATKAEYLKQYEQTKKQEELSRYQENHANQPRSTAASGVSQDQVTKLNKNRRTTPPQFFDATTGSTTPIPPETEDSLILLASSVKQMAAHYIDSLLGASPPKTDYSIILTEATNQRKTNVALALTDLDAVTATFEAFKTGLQGNGDSLFQAGTAPLLKTLSKGYGKVENVRAELKYLQTLYGFSERYYATDMTDDVKKEWRSWKRVLASYP